MANGQVIQLTESDFNTIVLKEPAPVVVDFWAPWCGPCRMVGPIIDQLAEEYDGKARVCKLNVDEQSKIAHDYGVMSIPTVMVFKNGKVVNKLVGAREKQEFQQIIDDVL